MSYRILIVIVILFLCQSNHPITSDEFIFGFHSSSYYNKLYIFKKYLKNNYLFMHCGSCFIRR